jgi:hypothetical protein
MEGSRRSHGDVILSEAHVILSEAKDLVVAGR